MQPTTEAPRIAPTAVLALDRATDAAHCGHKAAALAELLRAGCRVPDGFVIPAGLAPTPENVRAALERLGPGPWAVRSSGIAEDLGDASFAGQYESFLGVSTLAGVVVAAERVRTSGATHHATAYRRQTGGGSAEVAVLVQRQVLASAAGIAFSANPVTGDDEVVIEAVRGLGDRLAAGEHDADHWVDDGSTRPVVDTGVLDSPTAKQIALLARQVAGRRGNPQDIEWVLEGRELFIVQTRPITGLPQAPKFELPPGRWIKDVLHWSAPMTPAGASILLPALESGIAQVLEEFGVPLERLRARSFGGEVYTQEIEPGGKHNAGRPPPWWAGALAFRLVPSLRRIARNAERALPKLESYPRAWEESWHADWAQRLETERRVELAAFNDEALLRHLHHLVHEVLSPAVLVHFQLMIPDMVALHDLAVCCRELLGWNDAQMLELLAGLSTTATQPASELGEIAALAGAPAVAQGLDAVRATAAGPRLDAWLARWGLRTIDCDPGSSTISELPQLVLGLLRQPRPDAGAQGRKRRAAIERARAGLDAMGRERFDAALRTAERVHPLREENVLYTQSLPLGLIRRALLETGRRLAAAGQLRAAGDVVFLELDEIPAALRRTLMGESAAERVRRRRAERAWVSAHPGPAFHGPAPVPPPSVRGLPGAMQRIFGAFFWELALEETIARPPPAGGALLGTGASPGRATGRVRVIRHEADLVAFQPGEILVCPSTHSSWSVVFARAAGLVTDHGGMLSHPSIVAREYGLPAVIGTSHATARLATGQTVTVDGTTGRVEWVEAEPGQG